jgi:hypothetical protein
MGDRCRIYEALSHEHADAVKDKFAWLALRDVRVQRMVNVIENDFRVPRQLWQELADAVLDGDPDTITESVRNWCRSHLLEGPPSQWRMPLVRVIGKDQLRRNLEGQVPHGVVLPPGTAADIVDDLVDSEKWQWGRERCVELGLGIGNYVIWATFAESGGADFPDEALCASDIACDLGFDDAAGLGVAVGTDLPLLQVTYSPTSVECRFPTVIEAWASEPFNYYFQPAPAGMPWGLTQPWPNAREGARGRPEVVHSPTPLSDITGPLREIY